ncbi:MAG: hypothetical protein HOP29_16795 [Phycisphaerales bacterium]|nr:hypothetical protein [Phycisphaerales bacterium]
MPNALRRKAVTSLRRIAGRAEAWADRLHHSSAALARRDRERIAANAELRGIHAGRPAFVIGNGPSIRHQDLSPLADQITFVANAFWKHPLMNPQPDGTASLWQPCYYAMVDPLYTDGSAPMALHFEHLLARVPRCLYFVTCEGFNTIERHHLLPLERVRACVLRGNMARVPDISYDLADVLPGVQSVSLFGILAALHMGCSPIYLLGLDHDWLARPSVRCRHFYHGPSVEGHAEVVALEQGAKLGYLINVEAVAVLFRSYERLRTMADGLSVPIYNATRGGFLDVFPRIAYESTITNRKAGSSAGVRRPALST